ncbi:isoprenylcysteine carboxylmethyltransferase family protein [Thermomonas sp. LB-4]|uniref:methyltransferase family protein n=1 Tax=Thermomonas sp. LB-4 TaxID=3102790 RepID=UPI002EDB504F
MTNAPKVPPLVVLAAGLALAWLIDRFVDEGAVTPVWFGWGAGVVGIGTAVALAGVIEFRRARTTVDPMRPERASALVSSGIYRVTRNPMYLGFALILVGWIVALRCLPALPIAAVFVLYLDRVQIPPEEAALQACFGSAFDEYASRVRRWL